MTTTKITDDLQAFLAGWHSASPFWEVQTSGSTGTPKRLTVRKEQMVNSARLTCEYLGLREGDKALLCMPLRYIAGQMMVVRSLVAGLELVVREPSGHPMADVDGPVRFAAMVPMQVYNTLQVEQERERLCQTDILIIGGGAIDRELELQIQALPIRAYSTYGMTETLSHIALRRLNGPDASPYYTPFPSVALSLSDEGTLVIEAPLVADGKLVTNDVAELLPDGRFRILGRKDNIINSGGIKIQAEEVEEALRPLIGTGFAITSVADAKFGEAVVLLLADTAKRNCASRALTPLRKPRTYPYAQAAHLPPCASRALIPLRKLQPYKRASCNLISAQAATLQVRKLQPYKRASCNLISAQAASLYEAAHLPAYQRPKHIVRTDEIPLTGNGKIDRAACKQLAEKLLHKQ